MRSLVDVVKSYWDIVDSLSCHNFVEGVVRWMFTVRSSSNLKAVYDKAEEIESIYASNHSNYRKKENFSVFIRFISLLFISIDQFKERGEQKEFTNSLKMEV
jgi:hypothetical protein